MAIMAMTCVPWGMIAVFRAVFQNGGYNSCSCGMSFTSAPLFRSLRQRLQKLRREQRRACLFPDKQHERFQHPLIVIFVLTLPVLVPWSRCDARIYALNKRMGMNSSSSSSTRTDSSLLVVLGLMDSIHLYPVSIDHLVRYCSTNASAPAISPRLNPHTTSIETLVANAWITFLPFLSSLSKMISVNSSASHLFTFVPCLHYRKSGRVARLHLFCLPQTRLWPF